MYEDRLIRLETQLMYQENIIKEVNDILLAQQKEIEILNKTVKLLTEKQQNGQHEVRPFNFVEDKPPHY